MSGARIAFFGKTTTMDILITIANGERTKRQTLTITVVQGNGRKVGEDG